MSRIVTTEEYCTSRKIRGTGVPGTKSSTDFLRAQKYPLTPLSVNASLSPHKTYYEKDADGILCYYIDFNIGNFQFDEISIRTEGQHRLIVQGKAKSDEDDICREFTRDFSLPKNVDQYSIKAQLEETTRVLTLIGAVEDSASRKTTAANSLAGSAASSHSNIRSLMDESITSNKDNNNDLLATASNHTLNGTDTQSTHSIGNLSMTINQNHSNNSPSKLGSIKETRTSEYIDYEVYLGTELKDGQVNLEMVGLNTLVIKVNSSDWDSSGDYNLELKRQIKLPHGVDSQHTQHGIDPKSQLLLIKVPFK